MKDIIILFSTLLLLINSLECGEQFIEHCIKCNETNPNLCDQCEDNYVPYFHNQLCLPCNHSYYGQFGCEKCYLYNNNQFKCSSKLCEKNYCLGLDGNCNSSPGCEKCNLGTCQKCYDNYYTLEDGKCVKCEKEKCESCFYQNGNKVCEKCRPHFFLRNGQCYPCHYFHNINGVCEICSDNITDFNNYNPKTWTCICFNHYTNGISEPCKECPNNCVHCAQNSNVCYQCEDGYALNFEKKCEKCNNNCIYCYINDQGNSICLICKSGFSVYDDKCIQKVENCTKYIKKENGEYECNACVKHYGLNSNKQCVQCPSNCINCQWIGGEQLSCSLCENYYIIGKDDTCVQCQNIDEIGRSSCIDCFYNKNESQYKCLKCSQNEYSLLNEQKCIKNSDYNLDYGCSSSKYVNNAYICLSCYSNYIYFTDTSNCRFYSYASLSMYCQKAMTKNIYYNRRTYYKYSCLNCITNTISSTYYSETLYDCSNECNTGYFLKNYQCFKCDNEEHGDINCLTESGCSYDDFYGFTCNKCKGGYYFINNKCSSCFENNSGCKKCDYTYYNGVQCKECMKGYYLNETTNLCEPNKCEEYPEITPGCLICNDKSIEYLQKSKCQDCKVGYFKTKEESCIYCKARKNGGPGCEICVNNEDINNNQLTGISCFYCPEGNALNQYGKCFKCKEELGQGCRTCKYIKNENNGSENLKCTECEILFSFDSEGNCIYNSIYYSLFDNFYLSNNDNYFKQDGKYIAITIDDCSYISIITNRISYEKCFNFCLKENFVFIVNFYYDDYPESLTNKTLFNDTLFIIALDRKKPFDLYDFLEKLEINDNSNYFSELKGDLKSLVLRAHMCLGNLGTGEKNQPKNLRKCRYADYDQINDQYECIACLDGYTLDKENKTCIQNIKLSLDIYPGLGNCSIENIGTKANPIYSCERCNNFYDSLVSSEKGVKYCAKYLINGYCFNSTGDTYYFDNNYNCTDCCPWDYISNYIPYYSNFYKRRICISSESEIIKVQEPPLGEYYKNKYIKAINGTCESNKFFTPDFKSCFSCSIIEGCKGNCKFSNRTFGFLSCEENGCKSGYLRSSQGECVPCNIINYGCYECHYDNNYPDDYKGLKRRRRFICDECEEGFIKAGDGQCHNCSELGFENCDVCKKDETNDGEYICVKCSDNYFLDEAGKCSICPDDTVKAITKNICIECYDKDYGIEGCLICTNNNNSIICQQCFDGLILYNNECLNISLHKELQAFPNCIKLFMDNDKYQCAQCYYSNYVLLTENNINRCVSHDFIPIYNTTLNKYCEKMINNGTEDYPKYSCEKCIDLIKDKTLIRLIYEANNTAFCDENKYDKMENCLEAVIKTIGGINIFSCLKCNEKYILKYDSEISGYVCQYDIEKEKCFVKYCKECELNNSHFCSNCSSINYHVNPITGSCVRKTEKIPSIIWKEISELSTNFHTKTINGKDYYGPTLTLIGIRYSQINPGHAFLLNIIYNPENSLLRNLEEQNETKIPMICEVKESVDENLSDANLVEYNCIGDLLKEQSYNLPKKLDDIRLEEDSIINTGILIKSNLNKINLDNIYSESKYSFEDLLTIATFTIDNIVNQTSKNYQFNFTLTGKINKQFQNDIFDLNLSFVEINHNASCKFNISENKKADLICDINLEEFSKYNSFSFFLTEYEDEEKIIIFSDISEIFLIVEKEEEIIVEEEVKKKDRTFAIILLSCAGFLVVTAIIITIVFLIKKKKVTIIEISSNVNMNDNNGNNLKNRNNNNIYNNNINNINNGNININNNNINLDKINQYQNDIDLNRRNEKKHKHKHRRKKDKKNLGEDSTNKKIKMNQSTE